MFKSIKPIFAVLSIVGAMLIAGASYTAHAQTTFTYQGKLTDSSMSPTGVYDFQFRLYNPLNAAGSPIVVEDVQVTNGIFTAQIPVPAGTFSTSPLAPRSLEVAVRLGDSTGAFTILSPRQAITNAPYSDAAVQARNADLLNNLPASGFVQNNATVTPQTASFNITGSGTLGGTVTAENGNFANNLAVDNILTVNTGLNTFNASVSNNLSVQGNVTAQGTFTGNGSGLTALNATNLTSGTVADARLSSNIPRLNQANTFSGSLTANNITAIGSFAGSGSGLTNLNATNITTGTISDARIPFLDASKITSGTFLDVRLSSNIPRLNIANTFSGTQSANIFNATTQFNINGIRFLSAPGVTNIFAGVGAGGTASTGGSNSFLGNSAGSGNTSGAGNVFVGYFAGGVNETGINNTFIGTNAGGINIAGSNNTLIGANTGISANNLQYATAIGSSATVTKSNTVRIGRANGLDTVTIPGNLELENLNSGGGSNTACFITDNTFNFFRFAVCGSSLRYKTNVADFTSGLDLVRRLRPVTFTWKSNNQPDLGFVAEEVAAAEPLMATYNKDGQVEGVKYDRISAALVNAVNEQQTIIERQQKQIDALLKLVCAANPSADICRQEEK